MSLVSPKGSKLRNSTYTKELNMKNKKTKQNTPEGWTSTTLGSLMEFKNGLNKEKEAFGKGTPIVNYTDVYKKTSLEKGDVGGLVTVTENELANNSAQKGDVFFTRTSETLLEIGMASVLLDDVKDCVFSGYILRGRPTSNEVLPKYFSHSLRAPKIRKEIMRKSSMTTRALTTGKFLGAVEYSYPPKKEQERIIKTLDTWDETIEKLDRVIELKKDVKKGLMQKLLTGDLRVPGFEDQWINTTLGNICGRIKTGKLDANAMVKNGKYRFYTCAKDYYKIDDYAFDTEALLVSGNGANVGYVHYYKGKFNAYQRTYVLDNFSTDIFLIKYVLDRFLRKRIFEEKCDGNTPYIKMDTLTDMPLCLPKTIEEQKKIASILVSADSEIVLLKRKRKQLFDQKKYLLNNLVTGQIRTPENL